MISPNTIQEVIEIASIEDVVGQFLTLKKRGSNLIALCPFHNEKTPSFNVSPSKGIYKCFGCGESGNVVSFVMEHEKYSFQEAIRFLAEKYNIEVIETGGSSSAEEIENRKEKESLFIANNFAQTHFTYNLNNHPDGKVVGLSYFKERGFREDTIEKFQLGYALGPGNTLLDAAVKKGYSKDILKKAGLASEKNSHFNDFFKNRVVFAIHNLSGKVVGFGGRTLQNNKNIPKYINTPESDIYQKSKILYGIYYSKNEIKKQNECILVEGYTDVISLFQEGIHNVVASSGTALTIDQIRLLKRLTRNLTILFDGDEAGIKASIRGIDIALEQDVNVKLVMLPKDEDPDSYLRKIGISEFRSYLKEHSRDFLMFKAEMLMKDANDDPVKRSEAIREIVKSISIIPNRITRDVYVKQCGRILDVDERTLIAEINKINRHKFSQRNNISSREAKVVLPEPKLAHQKIIERDLPRKVHEQNMIRLLLEYGEEEIEEGISVTKIILHVLEEESITFDDEILMKMLGEFKQALKDNNDLNQKYFLHHEDPRIASKAIEILQSPHEISINWDKMFDIRVADKKYIFKQDIKSSLNRLKLLKLNELIDKNNKEIRTVTDDQRLIMLLKKQQKFLVIRGKLAEELGVVVI